MLAALLAPGREEGAGSPDALTTPAVAPTLVDPKVPDDGLGPQVVPDAVAAEEPEPEVLPGTAPVKGADPLVLPVAAEAKDAEPQVLPPTPPAKEPEPQILPGVVTGGQPGAPDLERFASAGGGIVLDIRDPMEPRPFDEDAVARELGLDYRNVPVTAGSLTDDTLVVVALASDTDTLLSVREVNARLADAPVVVLDVHHEEGRQAGNASVAAARLLHRHGLLVVGGLIVTLLASRHSVAA